MGHRLFAVRITWPLSPASSCYRHTTVKHLPGKDARPNSRLVRSFLTRSSAAPPREARDPAMGPRAPGASRPARTPPHPALHSHVGRMAYRLAMPLSDLAPLIAGLLGVALGNVLTRWNAKADREARFESDRTANDRASEEQAVLDLLVATRLLSHRANGFRMTTKLLQSRGARRQRRQGVMTPIDADAAFDRLVDADQALARASVKVWLTGSPEAVRLTNTLTLAAADVFAAHMDGPARGLRGVARSVELAYTKALPGAESRINNANAALGSAGKALAEYAREKYGLEYVDLFDLHTPVDGAAVSSSTSASNPSLHSAPTSGPHQGRYASLRDGLRPPLTRPLRQAPLLRYRVAGSPVVGLERSDGRAFQLRGWQAPCHEQSCRQVQEWI